MTVLTLTAGFRRIGCGFGGITRQNSEKGEAVRPLTSDKQNELQNKGKWRGASEKQFVFYIFFFFG